MWEYFHEHYANIEAQNESPNIIATHVVFQKKEFKVLGKQCITYFLQVW